MAIEASWLEKHSKTFHLIFPSDVEHGQPQ